MGVMNKACHCLDTAVYIGKCKLPITSKIFGIGKE